MFVLHAADVNHDNTAIDIDEVLHAFVRQFAVHMLTVTDPKGVYYSPSRPKHHGSTHRQSCKHTPGSGRLFANSLPDTTRRNVCDNFVNIQLSDAIKIWKNYLENKPTIDKILDDFGL